MREDLLLHPALFSRSDFASLHCGCSPASASANHTPKTPKKHAPHMHVELRHHGRGGMLPLRCVKASPTPPQDTQHLLSSPFLKHSLPFLFQRIFSRSNGCAWELCHVRPAMRQRRPRVDPKHFGTKYKSVRRFFERVARACHRAGL